jgi:acyl-CoA synthetase (AMP-forming)/AMP-acid ligase II
MSPRSNFQDLWQTFCATALGAATQPAFLQGERLTSYAELLARARGYRHRLLHSGIQTGDRVLVRVHVSAETASAIAGVWGANGIPVLIDPDERGPLLQHYQEVSTPRLGVETRPASAAAADDTQLEMLRPEEVEDVTSADSGDSERDCDRAASILFTSGSTGRPKGVTQSHGSLLRGCATVARYLGLQGSDRIAGAIPWSFDYGYGQLLTTLLLGITQVLPEDPGPIELCKAIDRHRPTVLPVIPSLLTYLFRGASSFAQLDLSSFRIVTNTGGRIASPILDDLLQRLGHCSIFLNYGLTESYRTSFLEPSLVRQQADSVGRAIPGVQVAVVRDDGSPADPGETGEILHRGDYLFREYWGDPEATHQALREDPLAAAVPASRCLFTGDLGYLDEKGLLYLQGRRDQQLKCMGVRVLPAEVEGILYQSGLLQEAAVFGQPHDLFGQEIWAAIVPCAGLVSASRQVAAYAHQNLSRYRKPRRYMELAELPKTPNGKVDYSALQARATRDPSAGLLP